MQIHTLIAIIIMCLQKTESARILALLTFPGKSHFINIQPVLQELGNRGHDVTVITPFSVKNATYKEIITDYKTFWEHTGSNIDIFSLESLSFRQMIDMVWEGTLFTTEVAFNSTSMKNFIKNDNSHFDLIITEIFYQEAMYMFAYKYKAPLVGLYTMSYSPYIANMIGNPMEIPYISHEFLNFGSKLTFSERLQNILGTIYDLSQRHLYLLPKHQDMAEKNFPNLPRPLPKLAQMEKQFTSVLVNGHFSYDTVKALVPGMVEIGGVHIKKPKALPENIKKFLDGAKDGAIFFSLGSNIKSKDMSQEKVKVFLDVFKKLKQRVLWKWESDNFEGMPDNLMLGPWLPQNDILAHPNIKLFITHGGLLSTQEALYNGVPIIGFPIYGDQHLNTERVEKLGLGIKLKYITITSDILKESIEKIVYDPNYKKNAEDISFRFKDRPISAMDSAIYWIEYAIRHKGAPFMRSPALDISLFVYYMVDIIALFLACVIALIIILYNLYKFSQRIVNNNSKSDKKQD